MERIKISCENERNDNIPTSCLPITSVPFKLETYNKKVPFFDVELNNLKRAYDVFLEPSDSINFLKEAQSGSDCDSWKDERPVEFCESQIVEEDEDLSSSTNDDHQYKCCNCCFEGSILQLKDHSKICHLSLNDPIKSNFKEQQVNLENQFVFMQNQTQEHMLYCSQCGKKFKRQSLLLAHLPVHDKIKCFKCPTCDKVFPAYRYLVRHLERHEKKIEVKRETLEHSSYKCNTCQKCFTKKESMIKHTRIHTRDLLKCALCDFTCNKKVALKMHVVSHEGHRKYKCDHCDFSFKQIGHLKRHIARFKH